ncbi:hypothetical protein ACFPK5_36520 [Streptomyces beijiangensis]|uniref:hypothetical protein n=1 Tax=Streptomyces beijiangensis TaxID=163361 RepID=UPI00337EE253
MSLPERRNMNTALVSAADRPARVAPRQDVPRVSLTNRGATRTGGDLPASVGRLMSTGTGTTPIVAAFQSSV